MESESLFWWKWIKRWYYDDDDVMMMSDNMSGDDCGCPHGWVVAVPCVLYVQSPIIHPTLSIPLSSLVGSSQQFAIIHGPNWPSLEGNHLGRTRLIFHVMCTWTWSLGRMVVVASNFRLCSLVIFSSIFFSIFLFAFSILANYCYITVK